MFSFQGAGIDVYRGVLVSGGWNRGFHCIESSFQGAGIDVYRGVLVSGGWNRCIQRCPRFRGLE